ncbi:MAG: UvrD-helicase domain-containing protein [Bacilli bacterium]|nr:UvrD-helicase domain-containing protein [Bacilli bacterium]
MKTEREKMIAEEKAYLEYVKYHLENNIEYNLKELKAIPKRHTNILQGDTFLVESLMSAVSTTLKRLEKARNIPYFARIDFLQDDNNKTVKLYIGKTSIYGDNQKLATIDWRAPICSLYYNSELGNVSYEAPVGTIKGELKLKRQIIIEKGQLLDAKDTSLVTHDELLQSYLNVHADNRMKNIIASIQKEQHKIISAPIKDNIIVQGIAGSGKTSVALHRIAYLVYNENKTIEANQFLVIGPNKYFLDYISNLLPDLEVESVTQLTFFDIAEDVIGEEIKLIGMNDALESLFKTNKLDNSLSYKSSLNYKNALDKFILNYIYKMINNDITLGDACIISNEEIKKEYQSKINTPIGIIFDNFQKRMIKKIKENPQRYYDNAIYSLNEKAKIIDRNNPILLEIYEQMEEIKKEIKTGCKKTIQKYFKKSKAKPLVIYKDFINNIEEYIESPIDFNIEEFKKRTLKNIFKKTLEYEDLAAVMYLKLNFYNYDYYDKYKQIVLDEAQDLGLFHFVVLKKIFNNGTFSIFGDLNQAIHSYRSIANWNDLNAEVFDNTCKFTTLDKSYRTTSEIMDAANNIPKKLGLHVSDALIRHGKEVTYIDTTNTNITQLISEILLKFKDESYKSIAIISKTDDEALCISRKLNKQGIPVNYISGDETKIIGGISSLASYNSKGLEFDAVIINNASEKVYSSSKKIDLQLLYVAMTRTLHELNILYDGEITEVLLDFLSKDEIIKKQKK